MKFYCLIKPYFLKLLLSFTLTFIMSSCKNISLDQIEQKLHNSKEQNISLIKNSTVNLQNKASEELSKLDNELNNKIEKSAKIIENNKKSTIDKGMELSLVLDNPSLAWSKLDEIKSDMLVLNPIKSIGEFEVTIRHYENITSQIKVTVSKKS